jgi:hypothetical protein
MLDSEVGDELVDVALVGFLFGVGFCDFYFEEMSGPFSEGVELLLSKPKRLILTSFMGLIT